jgi:PhnB protein
MTETVPVTEMRNMITPVLTVQRATEAIAFYERAFGAAEVYRETSDEGVVVAEMTIAGAHFRVADEAPGGQDASPETLRGTTVRLNLLTEDPDAVADRVVVNGGTQLAPVRDHGFGLRQGRVVDPFGHHWLIGRPLPDGTGDWALA